MLDDERGFTDEVWAKLVDLGWTGLLVPEEHGGLGLGLVDLAVVMEEMGRVPFPGPVLSSAVLATLAARHLGLDDRLASLAAGDRGTVALDELGHGDPSTACAPRRRKGGRWRAHGLKPVVLDGHTADWVLVAARTEHGIGTFLVEAPGEVGAHLGPDPQDGARLDLDGRRPSRSAPTATTPRCGAGRRRRRGGAVRRADRAHGAGPPPGGRVRQGRGCSSTGPSPRSR